MNIQELGTVTIRSIISLTALFIITKILGKKQVSQLSLFDYVIGISIGNFAAEITMNMEAQFINGILAMAIFGLIAYIVSVITMKSITLRRFFMGTPTPLIQNGKILEQNLKKVKFDINDLLEECRSNGYFELSEIEYALMESKGTLSILPKSEYKPVTNKDMNLKTNKQGLTANIIIDSKIMQNNLKNMNKDEKWLKQQLKQKGYKTMDKIILATLDIDEKLTIYERNLNEKVLNVLE
ncbi:MAG: DUF421 domain-containing protein [Bacilli bacterium]|nr:DUF421 domain-containing protein [Bacilli bacterium]